MAFAVLYAILVIFFVLGIIFAPKSKSEKKNKISVIVAARNEEKHIHTLLKSLEKQSYKDFEVIIIDDRSQDKTYEIVSDFMRSTTINIKLYKIIEEDEKSGKKKAVQLGISKASFPILAFTDADCEVPKDWLRNINKLFDDKTDYLCGYSELIYKNKFFTYLKNLERGAYLGCVAGAYSFGLDLSSAASNMAYRKEIFVKAGGFKGIDNVKSGDDDLLLHKMKPYIRNLKFMYSSIVKSFVENDAKAQFETEKRRTSKWEMYPAWIKALTLFIFIFYLYFTFYFFYLLFSWQITKLLILLLIKILPEFLLIAIFFAKIKRTKYIVAFPIAEIIYIPYFIYFGLRGLKGDYKWKE